MADPDILPLIAGNWKMNGLAADGAARARDVAARAAETRLACEVLVCPPATLLARVAVALAGGQVKLGGQDCHSEPGGAFTGDVSAEMLRDAGCSYVIVGHSERRAGHGETDAQVRAKALAARRAGLTAIVCVGESEAERNAGRALEVVAGQLGGSVPDGADAAELVVAYEPVWAIGTGRTPSLAEIAEVHGRIRADLASRHPDGARMRILYGGSVNAKNAADILAVDHVNGALVGGASLDGEAFWTICRSC
jgi:triosephosphate isomerase (TIM)